MPSVLLPPNRRTPGLRLLLAALLLAMAYAVGCGGNAAPEGFARGTGRLEAEEVHVAARLPGRVVEVLVEEGDRVEAGQLLARMDAETLRAEIDAAEARVEEAVQRRAAAAAVLVQRRSECRLAEKELERALALHRESVASQQQVDRERTRLETTEAACDAARARIDDAEAAVRAARAAVRRVREDLEETRLRAPVDGRVQYRLVEPGEVLPAGGRVVTILDISDVTLSVFLPTAEAGRAAVGAEARVVLDARPDTPLPARVAFVAEEAQFTPKEVETQSVREKLSFRVKLRVGDARGVAIHPGAPGVGWVRLDPQAPWPEHLQ